MPIYKPDIAQLAGNLATKVIRNLNDIARIINNLGDENIRPDAKIKASKIDWTGFSLGQISSISGSVDHAPRLCVWVIGSLKTVTNECERSACTGVLIKEMGELVIDTEAELLII